MKPSIRALRNRWRLAPASTATEFKKQEFRSVQILRATAAWMVVFHHCMPRLFSFASGTWLGNFFASRGAMGVDIFFVISGFVMYLTTSHSQQSASQFLANRVSRIVPVYWFYTLLMVLCVNLLPTIFDFSGASLWSLIASLFFFPTNNPSGIGVYPVLTQGWTLNFEMCFYCVLAASIMISRRHAISVCIAILMLAPLVFPSQAPYAEVAGSFLLFEFVVGCALGFIFMQRLGSVELVTRLVIVALLALATLAANHMVDSYPLFKIAVAGSVVAIALMAEPILPQTSLLVRALVRLGDYSYSTYLLHLFIVVLFINVTPIPSSSVESCILVASLTGVIAALSALSHRFVERPGQLACRRFWAAGGLDRSESAFAPGFVPASAASSARRAEE
jgi:exopolysaccharide production protein ExoZ